MPSKMKQDRVISLPLNISKDSGNKWRKASPKSPPTEKLTKTSKIFSSFSFFNDKTKIPTNETKLTKTTLIKL